MFVDFSALSVRVTAIAVSIRLGLGFVHFCYDRWIYKLSDPAIRTTIGADLFGLPKTAHSQPVASEGGLYAADL